MLSGTSFESLRQEEAMISGGRIVTRAHLHRRIHSAAYGYHLVALPDVRETRAARHSCYRRSALLAASVLLSMDETERQVSQSLSLSRCPASTPAHGRRWVTEASGFFHVTGC